MWTSLTGRAGRIGEQPGGSLPPRQTPSVALCRRRSLACFKSHIFSQLRLRAAVGKAGSQSPSKGPLSLSAPPAGCFPPSKVVIGGASKTRRVSPKPPLLLTHPSGYTPAVDDRSQYSAGACRPTPRAPDRNGDNASIARFPFTLITETPFFHALPRHDFPRRGE